MARHLVLTKKDKHFLLSNHSARIVQALQTAGAPGMTYSQLVRKTKAPLQSLYVFAQRLRAAKIIKSQKDDDNEVTLILCDPEQVSLAKAQRLG